MTLLEDRPAEAESRPPEQVPAAPGDHWLDTADHKRLGLLFLLFALLFLLTGVVLGELLRAHLAEPSSDILGAKYLRIFYGGARKFSSRHVPCPQHKIRHGILPGGVASNVMVLIHHMDALLVNQHDKHGPEKGAVLWVLAIRQKTFNDVVRK